MFTIPATADLQFVDETRLSLLHDISGKNDTKTSAAWKVILGISPRIEVSRNETPVGSTHRRRIIGALEYLQSNDLVLLERPRSQRQVASRDLDRSTGTINRNRRYQFVYEKFLARKVLFPAEAVNQITGLQQFAVWISDPVPEHLGEGEDQWEFSGMYLYLTEAHWDNRELDTVWSGCSALQAIVNYIEGRPVVSLQGVDPQGYFGEGSDKHPIERLERFGAVASEERKIISLYRMRYVTDEQRIMHCGVSTRVCDLLGYPLFIATI